MFNFLVFLFTVYYHNIFIDYAHNNIVFIKEHIIIDGGVKLWMAMRK